MLQSKLQSILIGFCKIHRLTRSAATDQQRAGRKALLLQCIKTCLYPGPEAWHKFPAHKGPGPHSLPSASKKVGL